MNNRSVPSSVSANTRHALSIVFIVLLLSACEGAGSPPRQDIPPPEVTVVRIEPRNLPATFEYTGQTVGSREVEVRARVTGILQKRNFLEGGAVTAGQSLFTVDPALYEAALNRAEADLGSAQARQQQSRREVARLKPLVKAKAVSQKEYDDAVSSNAIADAEVKVAQARVIETQLNLNYTRVESPISGIAGRALRSEGNYVSGPDVLLTTVTQIDPIYVTFGIPDEERLKLLRESEAGRLALPPNGQFDVNVRLAEGSVYPSSGKLNFSSVRVSGATGTSETRAELPNPNALLRPGQFVRVSLSGAQRPNAILVPQRAVLEGPTGKFVYVVNKESKAEARPVTLGDWLNDSWIVAAGLRPGDVVIVDGVMKLGPGAPVRVASPMAAKAVAGKPGTDAHAPTAVAK